MKRLTDLAAQLARLYRRGPAIGVDFQTIADHLALHVAVKDPELRYKYINLPGQVHQLLPSALSGQVSDADLLGSELGRALREDDLRALHAPEPVMLWSAPLQRPDGTLQRQPQIKVGLRDEHGRPVGLLDITLADSPASPETAQEVRRLNDALDLVAEVLGLVMRNDDELRLFEKVCAHLVLRGGYPAAAVIPVDGERRHAAVPLALAGDRAELGLAGAFRLDDPVWESHPVTRAAEAGICVVHREQAEGPDGPPPWRQLCPPSTRQTLIALPLKSEDDVWAVLLLACDGLDTFMPTRAVLLQRMADELALGVELLRSRQRLAQERRQREIHLRQQLLTSQRLSMATESGDVGLWEWNLGDGTVVMDDRVMAQHGLPGYTRTLPAETLQNWVHADDQPALFAALEGVSVHGHSTEVSFRTTPADGRERTLRLRMSPLREGGPQAAIVGVLGTCQDISAETVRSRQIRDLDAKLRLAVQATGLGLWELASAVDTDLTDQTLVLDARGCALHGLGDDQGSLPLTQWLSWVHPAQREVLAQALQEAQARPSVGQLECAITPPDGRLRRLLVNWASQADAGGRVLQLVGTHVDVTERRRNEARATQTHHRLALMAGATGVGQWRYTLQDGFFFDEPMYRLLGAAQIPHPATAWLMDVCLPPSQREALELALITADEHMEVGLQWQGLDGVPRHVVWIGTVERDVRRTVVRAEGLCVDVTLQQQLQQARQALPAPGHRSSPNAGQPTLASRVSSEVRTPLNAILGFVQLLRQGLADGTAPQEDYLGQVEQAGWQLLELINDAVDLSRLQNGSLRPDLQAVPLIELMGELQPLLEQAVAGRGARLEVPALQGWPSVTADRALLKQALLYLAGHAAQASVPGGRVTLGFEASPVMARLWIRYTGRDGEAERLAPLHSDEGAPPAGPLGAGLRLAVARQSILAMGGQVDTHEDGAHGHLIALVLRPATPAAPASVRGQAAALPAAPAALATPVSSAEAAAPLGRILYVEDNPSNVLLVRECLNLRPGTELTTATSVAAGLQALAQQRFDLVLADLQLPDGDGYGILARLREQPGEPIPCIALTASAMLNERDRALAAGFDEFWTKPLRLPEFLAGVDRWLGRPHAAADNGAA